MTDITTEAGKLLLGSMGHYEECPYVTGLPGPCSCGWPEAITAIEAEAYEKSKADTIARRWRASVTAAYEKGVADERARVRERVKERVEKLRRKEPWPQFVTAGSMEEAARTANNNVVDDFLAILEEETLDDR